MNDLVRVAPGAAGGGAARLSDAIARRAGLTPADLGRINAVQEELGLGFIEAAMRLKLITQSDLDLALGDNRELKGATQQRARASEEILGAHDPFQPFSEAIRALRTELVLRAAEDECNVIVVVSAAALEGRSRLAAELAVAFSQLGQDTLLVDADLRRPRQHELFGADNEQGLSQALIDGKAPQMQGVMGLPHLSLLPAGPRQSNPLELLSSPIFEDLLAGWRRRHQHLLIDTPSVAEYSDALAIASQAGRVLVVGRRHHTRMRESRDMLRRLSSTRAQVIGSVLNDF